ncbi:hypothetical protein C0581_04985 [Candidatus Parcubacteria bacterium]|nr:MAG: hypothetical protein C0581_04985 [Candidatus Parcubacteria bacterium]
MDSYTRTLTDDEKKRLKEAIETKLQETIVQEDRVKDPEAATELIERIVGRLDQDGMNIRDFQTAMAQELERLLRVAGDIFKEGPEGEMRRGVQQQIGVFTRFLQDESRAILFPPEGGGRDASTEFPDNVTKGPWSKR